MKKKNRMLKIAYRYFRENKHLVDKARTTPFGFQLTGNDMMADGTFEPEETRVITSILKHVDVMVNVGANIGYYCCHALAMDKQVVAFEPIDSNLRLLYKNMADNGWDDRIEVYPMALSDKSGLLRIFGNGTGASLVKGWAGNPEDQVRNIPASTMDLCIGDRLRGTPTFILVDIEGAELNMLRGAQRVIAGAPKPIWMLEITTTQHQPDGVDLNPNLRETFDFFLKNGYEAWTATDEPRKIEIEEVQLVASGGTDTLTSHNYLFLESGKFNEIFPEHTE